MAIFKNVESTTEKVLPIERDDFHVYIRTNIRRVDEPDTEYDEGFHGWVYDEEVLTLNEYIDRLENKIAQQEESNLNTMVGLAELYETLFAEEVI